MRIMVPRSSLNLIWTLLSDASARPSRSNTPYPYPSFITPPSSFHLFATPLPPPPPPPSAGEIWLGNVPVFALSPFLYFFPFSQSQSNLAECLSPNYMRPLAGLLLVPTAPAWPSLEMGWLDPAQERGKLTGTSSMLPALVYLG